MNSGEGNKKNILNDNLLVLSIDDSGLIVFFNKELEKQLGYYRNEVVGKKTFDLFIHKDYRKLFFNILNKSKSNKILNDFYLPLINKNGNKIFTYWDVAPVNDTKLGSIGFVGRVLSKETTKIDQIESDNKMIFYIGNKKICFKKPFFSSKNNKKSTIKKDLNDNKSKDYEEDNHKKLPIQKYDPSILKENFKLLDRKIENLSIVEKENNKLKKILKETENELSKTKQKLRCLEEKQRSLINNSKNIIKNSVGFIFDAAGGKKKKEEFENMMNELNERKETLKNLEEILNDEKIKINNNVENFIKWREKLENLEEEVEKRREYLVSREQKVKNNILSYVDEGVINKKELSSFPKRAVEQDPSKIIENLDTPAVILQRGILKSANSSFADIIGFSSDELLEKSFFDFISPEGLSSFEKYYLDRLKGENCDYYDTIFLTADNNELPVKVDIKPVIYNGLIVDKIVVIDDTKDLKGIETKSETSTSDFKKNQNENKDISNDLDNKDDSNLKNDSLIDTKSVSDRKSSQDEISDIFAKNNKENVEEKISNELQEKDEKTEIESNSSKELSSVSYDKTSQDDNNSEFEKTRSEKKEIDEEETK